MNPARDRSDLPVHVDPRLPLSLPGLGPEHEKAPVAAYPDHWHTIASQRHVNSVAVDSSGNVWLATGGGVLWWSADEMSYTRYGSEHGLPGNSVTGICVDGADQPWATTRSGTLCYLEGHSWQSYRQDPFDKVAAGPMTVSNAGLLWIATQIGAYALIDPGQPPCRRLAAETLLLAPRAMACGVEDEVWIATARGLYRHDGMQWRIESSQPDVLSLLRRENKLWVGTASTLNQIDLRTGSALSSPEWPRGAVVAMAKGNGGVWAAIGQQVGLAASESWRTVPGWRPGPRVTAIAPAGPGEIYIGTDTGLARGGLAPLDWQRTGAPPDEITSLGAGQGPDTFSNLVQALAVQTTAARSVLVVGSAGGLYAYNPDDGAWRVYTMPRLYDVRALVSSSNANELWVASGEGSVRRLHHRTVSTDGSEIPGLALCLAKGAGSDRWAVAALQGAQEGLYRHDGAQWRLVATQKHLTDDGLPPEALIRIVASDAAGHLWLGTSAGLFSYDEGLGGVSASAAVGNDMVTALLPLPGGKICVATHRGLHIGRADMFAPVPDLAGLEIQALLWDENASILWAGGRGGVAKLQPNGLEWKVTRYTADTSGLASDCVNALAITHTAEGASLLWIGTACGVTCLQY